MLGHTPVACVPRCLAVPRAVRSDGSSSRSGGSSSRASATSSSGTSASASTGSGSGQAVAEAMAAMQGWLAALEADPQLAGTQLADAAARAAQPSADGELSASAYLSAVMTQLEREAGLSGADAATVLRSDAGRRILWQTAREQFTAGEAALLDTAFGEGWSSGLADGLDADRLAASLAQLGPEHMAQMSGMLGKLLMLSRQMEELAAGSNPVSRSLEARMRRRTKPGASWGSSFRRRRGAAKQGSGSSSSRSSGGGSSSPAKPFAWADEVAAARRQEDSVQRLLALAGVGQATAPAWGVPPSQQFQMLRSLFQRMVLLEVQQREQQQQQRGQQQALRPADVEAAYSAISAEMNWLLQQVADEDVACRSAFWFMTAVFDERWEQPHSGSSSGGSGSAQQPQQRRQCVTLERLEQLGVFLAAAAKLEGLRAWLEALCEQHPALLETRELQEVASLLDDAWFVLPSQRAAALAAAEAAAAAAAAAAASPSSGGASPSEALAGSLQPGMIDVVRMRQLAALDADALWLWAEVEAAPPDSEAAGAAVLAKWRLHPRLGPELATPGWEARLALGEPLAALCRRARADDLLARFVR